MFRQISMAHLWYLAQLSKGLGVSTRKWKEKGRRGEQGRSRADWRGEGRE